MDGCRPLVDGPTRAVGVRGERPWTNAWPVRRVSRERPISSTTGAGNRAADAEDVHRVAPLSTDSGPLSTPGAVSVGVDQLPDRRDLASQLVVDRDFAGDLVAGVEDRGVVPAAELGTDPEK